MSKVLVRLNIDCGRQGTIDGLFITTREELKEHEGKRLSFYEVLGKHSEVTCSFDDESYDILSDDQEKINWLESISGEHISGTNPFNYLE